MGSKDRSFYRALMISLIFHGALLLSLQFGWWGGDEADAGEKIFHRSYSAVVVTTTLSPAPVLTPAPAGSSISTDSAELPTEDTFSPATPVISRDSDGTGTLPSVRPPEQNDNTEKKDRVEIPMNPGQQPVEKKPFESAKFGAEDEPFGDTRDDPNTSAPGRALPLESDKVAGGTKPSDRAGPGSPVGNGATPEKQQSFLFPEHHEIILRNEIERQLRLYIEKFKRYPDAARRRGLAGEVELCLTMKSGSRVELSRAKLVQSAGSVLLDREAQKLVESFFPYRSDNSSDINRTVGAATPDAESEFSTTVRISYKLR